MKFLKLEILNLASLDRPEGETIDFVNGALGDSTIFSIVGPTGSGKSTILDAICLALYNRAPRYPRKKGDRNQSIEIFGEMEEGESNRLAPTDSRNILTRGKKNGYSKLTFLANDHSVYRAEWHVRFLRTNYDNASTVLYKLSTTDGQINEEVANWEDLPTIIGLDYDQFLRTVLIAQGSFANFLTAKEDERYELLEKLIGCEETYSNIASMIKQKKDDAMSEYKNISANYSAQEKYIIPEPELSELKEKIKGMLEAETKAKEELKAISKALDWYTTEDKYTTNISKYEQDFAGARQKREGNKEQEERLALHDSTLPATSKHKDIRTYKEKISGYEKTLKELSEQIKTLEANIDNEEHKVLKGLNETASIAAEELQKQKPHINKARSIQAERDAAIKAVAEKEKAKNEAEDAFNKANKLLEENNQAIKRAEEAFEQAKLKLGALQHEVEETKAKHKEKVDSATKVFNEESSKNDGKNATELQNAKTLAEQAKNDLKDAIRIQSGLKEKTSAQKEIIQEKEGLEKRNASIDTQLAALQIDDLSTELETLKKAYALMTSEKWELHRQQLEEGQACPLCGATHHPYHNPEVFKPVFDEMKMTIQKKESRLNELSQKKLKLSTEKGENVGKLSSMPKALDDLNKEIENLNSEWTVIHLKHTEWPEEVERLQSMQSDIDRDADTTSTALKEYNTVVSNIVLLRNAKEQAETEQRNYDTLSTEELRELEKKRDEWNTALLTEKGKSDNLISQKVEKSGNLEAATSSLVRANSEVLSKTEELKAEIGDQDPDAFEKSLNDAKDNAEKAVAEKKIAIGQMREERNGLQGQEISIKKQKTSDELNLEKCTEELNDWLAAYNDDAQHTKSLSVNDIALIASATDDWEKIRLVQQELKEAFTKAETTLQNEKKAHDDHQQQKPKDDKETLSIRKQELENLDNKDLIEAQTRVNQHNDAITQMGSMEESRQKAENLKREWEEIYDAIGTDGKTLRKIAQCYTLRFLIEHANAEIKKFNNRYELLQVKNSLGIRVIDHNRADDIRDTTSLSGGETFIVSLGLALGLSSLSSRNISFENLFIDEGFGTLDPDTLATVIDSLAMLQSSQGKKVGVISHTDTMSERITTQIRVIKNGNLGSSHIEVYP